MADSSVFRRRRDIFLSHLGAYAAIIPAAELVTHHADCEYPFRQNSDFWYLTGFDEPNAVALFLPHKPKGEQYVLFVLPKESAAEVWTGFRWGTKGVLDNFDVDISHPLNELANLLPHYLNGAEPLLGSFCKCSDQVFKTKGSKCGCFPTRKAIPSAPFK